MNTQIHHRNQADRDLPQRFVVMSSDEKVLNFPKAEITLGEKTRRVMAEATRLASLAPGEWRLWVGRSAEFLSIPRGTLEDLIVAIIKDSEKKAREAKAEARREEARIRREQERERRERRREQEGIDKRAERNRKEKEKAFKTLISLPSEQHETRLVELAKRLGEDVAAIRDDFTAFVGMESRAASTDPWNVEPWPDPVETQALLQEISAKIRKYIVLRPEAVIATALWTMTAWAHEGTTHSPILAAISVEPDSGKSTLLGVLRFLVPKPFVSVEPTGPSVYRTVDREHPTLIIDEADDLFYRKSDLRAIVNAGWSRGTRIPRQGRWYDPFCPKILGILGKTKLPRTIASRSIILRMWPKKPEEKAEDFAYADDPEFSTLRRKLARWAADNVSIIKELKPPQPPSFNNRLSANWKLPLQIAQHARGGWPDQARRSAIYLSRTPYEPSIGVQLLAALRAMFVQNRTEITSEQVLQELLADPDSQWHEYRGRGPITKNQVAALLKDFEICPVVVHPTKRADFSRHGYRAAQFEDAFARFLPPEPNIRTLKRAAAERRESVRMFG
jgi:putative DNA primase/helicase